VNGALRPNAHLNDGRMPPDSMAAVFHKHEEEEESLIMAANYALSRRLAGFMEF